MHIWPQVTYFALMCLSTGMTLAKYGEPTRSKHDWTSFLSSGLLFTLLYCGGFFAPLGF